jgi:ADP-heptose:LPS heptosyltransferase
VLIDKGFDDEEALRAERLAARFPGVRTFQGSFAAFAAMISGSRLYVGYDSAGQHAAAASGTPLVSVFAGFPCPRMFERWRPTGRGPIEVVRVDEPDPDEVLERTLAAVDRLFALR